MGNLLGRLSCAEKKESTPPPPNEKEKSSSEAINKSYSNDLLIYICLGRIHWKFVCYWKRGHGTVLNKTEQFIYNIKQEISSREGTFKYRRSELKSIL